MSRSIRRLQKKVQKRLKTIPRPAVLVVAFVVVGLTLLVISQAATPTSSVELETGARANGASEQGNSTASGGKAVRFGVNTPAPATGKFYVVGKHIVDPDGNIFLPMGANVGMRQAPYLENNYLFNYFGTANDKSEQVRAWGWNTIRPNINCAPSGSPSAAETLAGLDQLVAEYTAKKLVVMITCRVTVGTDYAYSSSTVQASLPMIKTIAQKYKNNPYVWMNTFNEPIVNQPAWTSLNQSLYNDVRALAPDMIFVADLAGLGNQIETIADGNLATTFGAGKCNVIYDWHAYGFINGYGTDATHQQYINRVASKNIALVVGEFGDPIKDDGSPLRATDPTVPGVAGNPDQNRIGANAVMSYGPAAGYGLIWWIATGDSNQGIVYSLTKDKSSPWTVTTGNAATKLAPAGKRFWDLSRQSHNLGRFNGNIADSGCASAQ
ncbi:hypothetical protein EKI60_00085 [Candidatus Saccharibacteria bacterium]|nr:MAG: hypothetical protein EKI60_00085 [Candidatus Saccharibacteria bacterium]